MSNETPAVPRYRQPKFLKDFAERVLWTAVQAGLATVSFNAWDLPLWSLPIIAAGLSAVKGFVAKQVGNPDSASTLSDV